MSSGHDSDQEPVLNSQALDRLLRDPKVRQALLEPLEEDDSCDCPYLAGYSKPPGNIIFFDRHLPKELSFELDGRLKEFNPRMFVRLHEQLEKILVQVLGYDYWPAHAAANGYERRHVLMVLGPGAWKPYSAALDPFIKSDETEKLKKVPKDLDMTPYFAEPHDKALIARIQSAQGRERRYSKADVRYADDRGTPKMHCGGKPSGWGPGCKYFEPPGACELVRGYIAPRGLCDEWAPYEPKK